MSEKSPEHRLSPIVTPLHTYEVQCYWRKDNYADVIMNVSNYLEADLGVDNTDGFLRYLLQKKALPDQLLFENNPREAEELLKLMPATEMSNDKMMLLSPSEYQRWFMFAVGIGLNCDKKLHSDPATCLSHERDNESFCKHSDRCPLRTIRNKVINDIFPDPESFQGQIWNPAVTEEIIAIELDVIARHNLIRRHAVPKLINAFRQNH